MSQIKNLDKARELKNRAMKARIALRSMGVQYGAVLKSTHPELADEKESVRLYKVANGIVADEAMTLLLEMLVQKYSKAVA